MPYAIGLQSINSSFASAGLPTLFTCAAIVLIAIIQFVSGSPACPTEDDPISLPGGGLTYIYPFFRRRFDFLNLGLHQSPIFQFKLLANTVIVVSGEEGRKSFFAAKSLDLTEGFKMLSGAIPMIRGVTSDLHQKRVQLIHKRLAAAQKSAHIVELMPVIIQDCERIMGGWGTSGQFDPFDKIYELMFSVTVRSLSCAGISDDIALVDRLKKLYDQLDSATTPATVITPWLPTPAMVRKLWATKNIYGIVTKAISDREKNGTRHNDTLQLLMDSGDEKLVIVGFIMGLLIAGARATGTTASWLITFLGSHSSWQIKAREEIQILLAAHPFDSHNGVDSYTLADHMSVIPLEAWESETPVLDMLIRETLRLAQPHTAMRRNVGPDMYICDKRIETGAYVVYPFSDVHLNPNIYANPWRFNPQRAEPETSFGYVGWGGGKTSCAGRRLAQIQLKLVTAMMLLHFQHATVNKTGVPVPQPIPNWNDILKCKPAEPTFIKYDTYSAPS